MTTTDPVVPTTAQPATPGEALARLFHETYEQLAPEHGYRTREASAKPWEDVPEQNRALMVATCEVVLRRWADKLDAAPAAPTTYALPAEPPPEVTELWEVRTGRRWEREEFPGYVRWRSEDNDGEWRGWLFRQFYELLAAGLLSSVPPAGTEGDRG